MEAVTDTQMDPFKVREYYKYLRVVDVVDALDGIGYFNVGLVSSDIRPLWLGMRFWGVAFTLRCVPSNKPMWKLNSTQDIVDAHKIWFDATGRRARLQQPAAAGPCRRHRRRQHGPGRPLGIGEHARAGDGAWILYAQSQYPEKVEIDVAPIPPPKAGQKPVNVVSVGGYVVFAQCKHPTEAAKFVRFMASPEAQQYRVQVLKTGVSPDVVNEPYAKETFAKWPALAKVQSYTADGALYPVTPRWARIIDSLQPAIEAIGSGADPKQTLDDAARQANRSLRRA